MLTFKDIMKRDIETTFFNAEEFAEKHTVDGKELNIIVDGYEQLEREKRYQALEDGIHAKQVLFYVAAADFGRLPKVGRLMTFDNANYRVTDAIREGGVYSISLEAAKS